MSEKASATPIVIRLLLDLQAEETSYVDLEFSSLKNAKRAINEIFSGNGAMVMIQSAHDVPVLVRTSQVSAAFPIEYDGDEEDEEEE
jgi:hypothetical protein